MFASSIAFLTASFSSCVKFAGSSTGVLAGTTGSVLSACVGAFSVTFFVASAGFFPFSVCVTFTISSLFRVIPSGTSTDQVPSSFTSVSPMMSSPFVTTIPAPFIPVPEILLSFSVISLITGVADVSCSASFQTAYTVFASVIFSNIPSSAAVAVFELAQPTNSFPSLVGFFAGGVTVLSSFVLTLFSVVPSSNFPPFASNFTSFSSDHTA